jgi:predicted lysophospholipase L1 biosynthesis ABC-type transport system permease subunit
LRETVLVTLSGLAIGLPAAIAVNRAARARLFGVEPHDPWSLALGAAAIAIVAFLDCLQPLRRAVSILPARILRVG